MEIVEIETPVLKSYEYPNGAWVLVRVRTASGIEGVGECFVPDRSGKGVFAAKAVIDQSLKDVVVGQSVLETGKIWERMYEVCGRLYDRRGLAIHAVSGIDMAVHDAAGKALGQPLHILLGGCFRARVKVYVSSVWVSPDSSERSLEDVQRYVGEGYKGIKCYGWSDFGSRRSRDIKLLEEIRKAAGDDMELMLDLGRPKSLSEALRTAKMIEDSGVDIAWWEEPLSSSDDVENLAELNQRTDLTIAAGESEITSFAIRDLLRKKAVGVVQPDLSWVGGITEGKRIAELSRFWNVPLVPHNWGTAINFAASIQLVASMPRGELCEYPITRRTWGEDGPESASPMMTDLVFNPVEVQEGYARVPDAPGIGIELNEDVVAEFTITE
jgi:L-alanine-DL-glutamate epimerase-like enolase superfamily enzyme